MPYRHEVEAMHKAYQTMGKEDGEVWVREHEDAAVIHQEIYSIYKRALVSFEKVRMVFVIAKDDRIWRSVFKFLLEDDILVIDVGTGEGEVVIHGMRTGLALNDRLTKTRLDEVLRGTYLLSPLLPAFAQLVRSGTGRFPASFVKVLELTRKGFGTRREGDSIIVDFDR